MQAVVAFLFKAKFPLQDIFVTPSWKVIFTIDEKNFSDLQFLSRELKTYLNLPASDYSIAIINSRKAK